MSGYQLLAVIAWIALAVLCVLALVLSAAKRAAGKQAAKKKKEFSKILAAWAVIIATLTIAASVVLAVLDKQVITDLSIAVFSACIGYLITYAGKSAFEKNSRNKHGLDENGNPYNTPEGE